MKKCDNSRLHQEGADKGDESLLGRPHVTAAPSVAYQLYWIKHVPYPIPSPKASRKPRQLEKAGGRGIDAYLVEVVETALQRNLRIYWRPLLAQSGHFAGLIWA